MPEMIKGLINVRDALSLIAFLSLVLLMAFRTRKVPELLFSLVRDKLTRQQFAGLLHRFMILTFVAFLALVSLAVLAQILNHITQPHALTIDDLRRELAKANAPEEQKIHAEAQYKLATERLNQRELDGAIAALNESIRAVPTLTAQEVLTYLYGQKGDFTNESAAWENAVKTARTRRDTLALTRLDRIGGSRVNLEVEGEHDLIGNSAPLPKGGDKYETATRISPGFYSCTDKSGCQGWWFSIDMRGGERLNVKFRTAAYGGSLAGVSIFGTNGEFVQPGGNPPGTMHGNAPPPGTLYSASWTAAVSGLHFLRIDADAGTVFRIQLQGNSLAAVVTELPDHTS